MGELRWRNWNFHIVASNTNHIPAGGGGILDMISISWNSTHVSTSSHTLMRIISIFLMKPAGGEKPSTTLMSRSGYGYLVIARCDPSASNAERIEVSIIWFTIHWIITLLRYMFCLNLQNHCMCIFEYKYWLLSQYNKRNIHLHCSI